MKKETEYFQLKDSEGISGHEAEEVVEFFQDSAEELLKWLSIKKEEVFDNKVDISIRQTTNGSVINDEIVVSNPLSYSIVIGSYKEEWMDKEWRNKFPVPFHQVTEELGHYIGENYPSGWKFNNEVKGKDLEDVRKELIKDITKRELHGVLASGKEYPEIIKSDMKMQKKELEEINQLYSEKQIDYIETVQDRVDQIKKGLNDGSISSNVEKIGKIANKTPNSSKFGNNSFSEEFLDWNLPLYHNYDFDTEHLDLNELEKNLDDFVNIDREELKAEMKEYKLDEGLEPAAYLSSRALAHEILNGDLKFNPEEIYKGSAELETQLKEYNEAVKTIYNLD